jgi:hypothetical protein
MNPVAERFVGSLRREALDHVLLLNEEHLGKVAREYVRFFNKARPHQGMGQRIPEGPVNENHQGKIVSLPVLGGLPSRLSQGGLIASDLGRWKKSQHDSCP